MNVIIDHPEMLKALSPVYALKFMVGQVGIAFFALAAVVLAVTGAEALSCERPVTSLVTRTVGVITAWLGEMPGDPDRWRRCRPCGCWAAVFQTEREA